MSPSSATAIPAPVAVARFADVVEDHLFERDWSRRRLARSVGVDPAHITRVLQGPGRGASPQLMERVARVLDVPPECFAEYREWIVLEAIRRDDALRERVYRQLRPAGDGHRSTPECEREPARGDAGRCAGP